MSDHPRPHHRPTQKVGAFFDSFEGGADPALVTDAADRAAHLLVRGVQGSDDPTLVERVVHLADSEGIDVLAELWSSAPADSLAGCLWRLYVLRQWVHGDPSGAARDFEAGRARAQVAHVVAGVADPPRPEELMRMVDDVLRGIVVGDFADVLFRASGFARVIAAGRASSEADVARILTVAEQLEAAGHAELAERLA